MPPTRRTATVEFVRGSVRGTRRRALATLPSLFTLGNMFCGFFAILVSIRGDHELAAVLVGPWAGCICVAVVMTSPAAPSSGSTASRAG